MPALDAMSRVVVAVKPCSANASTAASSKRSRATVMHGLLFRRRTLYDRILSTCLAPRRTRRDRPHVVHEQARRPDTNGGTLQRSVCDAAQEPRPAPCARVVPEKRA